MEKANKANDVYIRSINLSVDGAAVKQTNSGQYYIMLENANTAMSASDLTVTLGGSAKITSKTYDADKQLFELMLTAQDGSTKNLAIYVAAQPASTADFSKPFAPQNATAPTTVTAAAPTTVKTAASGTTVGNSTTDTDAKTDLTTTIAAAATDADSGGSLPVAIKILLVAFPILLIFGGASILFVKKSRR